jgi:hypothetical protein
MSIIVDLKKINEDQLIAQYSFSSVDDEIGIVEINKNTGRCSIIKELPGDRDNFLAHRAMWALMRNWRENKLVENIHWVS